MLIILGMLLSFLYSSSLTAMLHHIAKPRTGSQHRAMVVSYDPNMYLGKKRDAVIQQKAQLEHIIENAHTLMLPSVTQGSNTTYHLEQTIIANALSAGDSLHDHRCTWLWPHELTPLFKALSNSRGTIVGIDTEGHSISTFHSWNFPFHKLKKTLTIYRADAYMDDEEGNKELIKSYTDLINKTDELCERRFDDTRTFFAKTTAIHACAEYHKHVSKLKKMNE